MSDTDSFLYEIRDTKSDLYVDMSDYMHLFDNQAQVFFINMLVLKCMQMLCCFFCFFFLFFFFFCVFFVKYTNTSNR